METIENEFLKIKVNSKGAELCSLFDKKEGVEHLWQADNAFWAWHAPILFPVVGRNWEDKIWVNKESFILEKHGFVRTSDFELFKKEPQKIEYILKSSENTLAKYPFHFELIVGYELIKNKLRQYFKISNVGLEEMFFALGGHPAFNVPFFENENQEDYFIEFEKDVNLERHHIDAAGFFDGRKTPVLENTNQLFIKKNMFEDDAYIFKNLASRKVSICSKKHSKKLTVTFKDFDFLGLWAKVNAPYICIEPWLGCADTANNKIDFAKKEGIQKLLPQENKTIQLEVEIGTK